jgi:hypothetical protein
MPLSKPYRTNRMTLGLELDRQTRFPGLPGKPEGIDGSKVEQMVRAGPSLRCSIREVLRHWAPLADDPFQA